MQGDGSNFQRRDSRRHSEGTAQSWRLAILAIAFCAVACASDTALTPEAQRLRVLRKRGSEMTEINRIRDICEKLGRIEKGDDRGALINGAVERGADTVILEKGETYGPDWIAYYYRCGQPSVPR